MVGRHSPRKPTLGIVEAQFPPLTSIEAAQQRLERINVWACSGLMAGSVASAAVRSIEVWLRASEAKLTHEVVEDLKGEVERLRAEWRR